MPLRLTVLALLVVTWSYPLRIPGAKEHAVPVSVKRVLIDPVSNSPVVILESLEKQAVVPIWIGTSEAASIALELEQRKLPRPNSHDLIQNLLSALDAKLSRVTITELKNNTYYAVITLTVGGRELHIDSRPSDAIAVALRTKARIYAAPELLTDPRGLTRPQPLTKTSIVRQAMGIQVQDLTAELAELLDSPEAHGVLIASVDPDGPASQLDFRRGDVITRVDQTPIRDTAQLEALVEAKSEPQTFTFHLAREGKPITVVVDLCALGICDTPQ